VLGLSWQDVNLDRRTARIRQALQYQPGTGLAALVNSRCPSVALDNHASLKIKWALTSTFAVELRGLEPLTSSMPSTVGR
jgi:hypothetical protein